MIAFGLPAKCATSDGWGGSMSCFCWRLLRRLHSISNNVEPLSVVQVPWSLIFQQTQQSPGLSADWDLKATSYFIPIDTIWTNRNKSTSCRIPRSIRLQAWVNTSNILGNKLFNNQLMIYWYVTLNNTTKTTQILKILHWIFKHMLRNEEKSVPCNFWNFSIKILIGCKEFPFYPLGIFQPPCILPT
jgi:hypothetical protein